MSDTHTPDDADQLAQSDQYEALTIAAATNADVQTILLGKRTEPVDVSQAELGPEGHAIRVQRRYEPVQIVETDEPVDAESVTEWLDDHRDHDAFSEFDWAAHDRRGILATAVDEREQFRELLASVQARLGESERYVASAEAMANIADVRSDIATVINDGLPTTVEQVEPADGGGDDG